MSGVEIKCSYCQASFEETEGTCPYCGRTVNQIRKEAERQNEVLSGLQKQIDERLGDYKNAKAWENASPILERLDSRTERIENEQRSHRQETKEGFQKLEGKLDDCQKALLEGMREILAQEEGIDAGVKAYFEKAIPLREKEGPDASEKVGEETIYASPVKYLEQMKEGEAAPFPEFFNCVGFELRSRMEAALKRLGVPAIENTQSFNISEAKEKLGKDRNNPDFSYPMPLKEDAQAAQTQKDTYWKIRENTISVADKNLIPEKKKPSKGLQGFPIQRFLCVLGDKGKANKLCKGWDLCNQYVHGTDNFAPLLEDQLSGDKTEARREKLLALITVINDSGLLGEEKI